MSNREFPAGPPGPVVKDVKEFVVYQEASEEGLSISFFGQLNHTLPRTRVSEIMPCGHPSVVAYVSILATEEAG